MRKKVLISLAPLLTIAALAVVPTAQASLHWFKNGSEIKSSVGEVPIVGWGTLSLEAAEIGTIVCQNVAGGDILNTGNKTEGEGTGEIEAFVPYDCTGICATEWKVSAEGLPWDAQLVASEEKVAGRTKVGTAKPIIIHIECPSLIVNEKFKGELTPSNNAGTSGTKPSFLEFGAGSGHLTAPVLGEGKAGGKAKVEGYNEQEVITAK